MTGRVLSVAHTGVTVSDMRRALDFFGEGLGGTITEPVLHIDPMFERITGVEGAQIEIAYVELAGHTIELLRYHKPESRTQSTARPCDPGHMHLSLKVYGIEALVARLEKFGFRSVGPIEDVPEAGFSVIYAYGFDNLVVELMDYGHANLSQASNI